MRREDLEEFHYITPITNVPSILELGILSNSRAANVSHQSVALAEIQARRARIQVPAGQTLHEYANLYFTARNPMLYLRQARHQELCVLRISASVLDLPGVVIADRNASSDHTRFGPAPTALELLDREIVFADVWTHPDDQISEWRHKSIKCAEVLVPEVVSPSLIIGAYVSCHAAGTELLRLAPGLDVQIKPYVFFR